MTEKEFTSKWIDKIKKELLIFPERFVEKFECVDIKMPGKNLLLAPPLFGSYEVVDSDGNIYFHTDNHQHAKYLIYANRNKPLNINLPKLAAEIESAVKEYEKHIDGFLKEMEKDFKKEFPVSKNFPIISAQVFNSLNLIRQ